MVDAALFNRKSLLITGEHSRLQSDEQEIFEFFGLTMQMVARSPHSARENS
jgi:hypothetical protein